MADVYVASSVEEIRMASDLSEKVLHYLDTHESVDTLHLAVLFNVDHQKVIGAVKSLQALGDVSDPERMQYA